MARRTPEKILRRYDAALKIKRQWRSLLDEAYEYFLPNRNLFHDSDGELSRVATQGEKKVDRVFDSSGQLSMIKAANRLQADLFPPGKRFVELQAGPSVPDDKREELNRALFPINERLDSVFNASNFDMALGEMLPDLLISTGAMLISEGDQEAPVMYQAAPLGSLVLEVGAWGRPVGVYRMMEIDVRDREDWWPDWKDHPSLAQKVSTANQDIEVKLRVVEATYQSDGQIYYDVVAIDEKARVVERQYDSMPWVTPRWQVTAGEVYGRGPAIIALPSVKVLNKVVELYLRAAALRIIGVYTGVADGVLNPQSVKIRPGIVIPVKSNGGSRGPSLQALPQTADPNLAFIEREHLAGEIKQIMFDRSLPPEAGPVRSATEIIERIRELAQDITGPFGRLYSELVVPLVKRTLMIMTRRGLLDGPVPLDGLIIKAVVVSPLAREQDLADVEVVVNWLTIITNLLPETKQLGAVVEKLPGWLAMKLGVDPKLYRTEAEVEDLQRKVGMMAGQQAQASGGPAVPGAAPTQAAGPQLAAAA